jgi:tetratricopeptide (TPR) repeat protein
MRNFMQWLATAATLTFAVPVQGAQNDPRLGALFAELANAETPEEAEPIEQTIWKIWLLSGNGAVDADMLRGLQAMGQSDNAAALEHFTRVVEASPDFAEGWNKRATANYLLGRFDASVFDIQKTLALEPRHFGALSGLALINLALDREREALKAFEAALRVHPNLPGAETHIRALQEKIRGKGI